MSHEDYDSAQMPFFMKDKNNEFKVNNKDIPTNNGLKHGNIILLAALTSPEYANLVFLTSL